MQFQQPKYYCNEKKVKFAVSENRQLTTNIHSVKMWADLCRLNKSVAWNCLLILLEVWNVAMDSKWMQIIQAHSDYKAIPNVTCILSISIYVRDETAGMSSRVKSVLHLTGFAPRQRVSGSD